MTERREVYESLDLALRIGEVLLSSGAGAADVTATMLAVTRACGVHRVTADVTFVDLTLHHQPNSERPAAIQVRRVTPRPVDYADLVEVSPFSPRGRTASSSWRPPSPPRSHPRPA